MKMITHRLSILVLLVGVLTNYSNSIEKPVKGHKASVLYISGNISNEHKDPLKFVSVSLKQHSMNATLTKLSGSFYMEIIKPDDLILTDTLLISYADYLPLEIPVQSMLLRSKVSDKIRQDSMPKMPIRCGNDGSIINKNETNVPRPVYLKTGNLILEKKID